MPDLTVEAAVYTADTPLPTIVSIPLTDGRGRVSTSVEGRPARVVLDPNTTLFASWTFEERLP